MNYENLILRIPILHFSQTTIYNKHLSFWDFIPFL